MRGGRDAGEPEDGHGRSSTLGHLSGHRARWRHAANSATRPRRQERGSVTRSPLTPMLFGRSGARHCSHPKEHNIRTRTKAGWGNRGADPTPHSAHLGNSAGGGFAEIPIQRLVVPRTRVGWPPTSCCTQYRSCPANRLQILQGPSPSGPRPKRHQGRACRCRRYR
jgi:hypothetical protein